MEQNKSKLAAAKAKLKDQQPQTSDAMPPIKRALAEISAVEGLLPAFMHVDVTQIDHLFNPRDIPCTLHEIRAIAWPSLDIPDDAVRDALLSALDSCRQEWWNLAKREGRQDEIILFFEEIHSLALMLREDQIHNIVLNRVRPQDNRFVLLAGERRVIAALYSRGLIPVLMAKVYTGLSPLQCRKVTDQENTGKALKPHETVAAKLAIWEELGDDKDELEVKDLARIWHVAIGTASVLRRLFNHPLQASYLETIRKEKLGWREINAVVSGRVAHLEDTTASMEAVLKEESGFDPGISIAAEAGNQQDAHDVISANPSAHRPVSTVETDPKDTPATQSAASVRKQLKEAASNEAKAARLGLSIRKNTDLTVIKGVLSTLAESNRLPKRLSKALRSVDYESRDAVLDAWCELADVFKELD
jgi:hypothetical protein